MSKFLLLLFIVFAVSCNNDSNKKINIMRKNTFLIIKTILLLMLFSSNAFSQGGTLEGAWIIEQVKIKKTVNGVAAEKTYSKGERIESFISCPQKVTFKAGNKVVFEYSGQESLEAEYTVEGNKIKIKNIEAMLEYGFTITGTNTINLTYSIDYVYNRDNQPSDKIKEEFIFYGNKP